MLKIKTYGKKHKNIYIKENLSNYNKFKSLIASKQPAENWKGILGNAEIDGTSSSPAAEPVTLGRFDDLPLKTVEKVDNSKTAKKSIPVLDLKRNSAVNIGNSPKNDPVNPHQGNDVDLQSDLQKMSIKRTNETAHLHNNSQCPVLPNTLPQDLLPTADLQHNIASLKELKEAKHRNNRAVADSTALLDMQSGTQKLEETIIPRNLQEEILQDDYDVANLSADMSRLYTTEEISYAFTEKSISDLLTLCDQQKILEFDEFFQTYPTRKIGEASYSDVFQDSRQAIKIIPLGVGDQLSIHAAWLEIASTVKVGSIVQEVGELVARHFVKIQRMGVVSGLYPKTLVEQFDVYDEKNSSENVHPSTYDENQIYLILCLDFAGNDLEHSTLLNNNANSYARVISLLIQLIISLGQAEDQISFEHRYLKLNLGIYILEMF